MELNRLARYHWAKWLYTHCMDGALRNFERGADELMWECLLNWAYYMDIADDLYETHRDEIFEAIRQSKGEFR